MRLVVDHLTSPKVGEHDNGDAVVVRHEEQGSLVAVVDALGHGPAAAAVAQAATSHLLNTSLAGGMRAIISSLHDHLRGSRGAAAMVLTFFNRRIEGCGIGNVELRSYGTGVPAVLTPGILGRTLPRMRIFEAELVVGDRLLIYSDGISTRFDGAALLRQSPAEGCRSLMDHHRHAHDDATVLMAQVGA